MTAEASRPVRIKISIITARIFPRRRKSAIPATVDEMEKNTSGTITVNSRFKKMSPSGLSRAACAPQTTPRTAPTPMEAISRSENP